MYLKKMNKKSKTIVFGVTSVCILVFISALVVLISVRNNNRRRNQKRSRSVSLANSHSAGNGLVVNNNLPNPDFYGVIDIIVSVDAPCPCDTLDGGVALNDGGSSLGSPIFLCVKKGYAAQGISDVVVIRSSNPNTATCPAGFEKININLNPYTEDEYTYICVKRNQGRMLKDIRVISSETEDYCPMGFEKVNVNINEDSGNFKYLCKLTW